MTKNQPNIEVLEKICRRAHYFFTQMIHLANNRDDHEKTDPKVGGHPAACGSALHILGALHLWARGPSDFMAIKPHASPADHSYNYLLGNLFKHGTLEKLSPEEMSLAMTRLRKFSQNGEPVFQSYHSGWDPDGMNYCPSGTVGIPPVNLAYLAHAYRFAQDQGFEVPKDAHFWALIGDSEFREGSLYEAIPDAAEREISNLTWIVDYNRQSLDGHRITNQNVMDGSDDDRIERTARANGWEVFQVKHGRKRLAAFKKPDGELLRKILEDKLLDYEYQSVIQTKDGAKAREALQKIEPKLKSFLKEYSDAQVYELMTDLGGHDMSELIKAFDESKKDRIKPTLIIAHTIKGWGLECMAVSGNHSMLPEQSEVDRLRESQGVPATNLFERFSSSSPEGKFLKERGEFLYKGLKDQNEIKKRNLAKVAKRISEMGGLPDQVGINLKMVPIVHTQWMLGQLSAKLSRIANTSEKESELKSNQKALNSDERKWKVPGELFVTMAPDVGTSTNLNPNMDGKVFGPEVSPDFETTYHVKDTKSPDIVPGEQANHRHLRFEIAEGNAMSCVGSYGKLKDILGVPFIPMMTVYDFFIKRALDQFFYNLYWNSSFIAVGTPSGVSLSPEGAQHGWKSTIQIPNMITWEPMFAVELDWIITESIRLHLEDKNQGRTGVLLRLVTRGVEQAEFLRRLRRHKRFKSDPSLPLTVDSFDGEAQSDEQILSETRKDLLSGGYYLVDYRGFEGYEPGDNVVNIFAMGTMGTEALKASDRLLKERKIFANVIMVSSQDLLVGNLGHENDYNHLRNTLQINSHLYLQPHLNGDTNVADVVTLAGRRIPCVSVHDGEPGILSNIGSIIGVRHECLAVRHHSKSGRPSEIYKYHGIDGDAVFDACGKVLAETALEEMSIPKHAMELFSSHSSTQANVNDLWPQ